MFLTFHLVQSDFIIFRLIKKSQQITGGKKPLRTSRQILFRNQPLFQCPEQMQIGISTVYITAVFNCQCRRFLCRICYHMLGMEISECPAVGNKMPLKAPVCPQNLLQGRASAAGLPVCPVIGSHHSLYLCFLYQLFKGGQIGFIHILFRCLRVKFMPEGFRAGMDCKVLRTGGCLQIFAIPLQALHISLSQLSCQIRVLPIGFMTSSPSGVPENIHIGGPESKTFINIRIPMLFIGIIFCTALCCDCIRHLL